MKTEKTSSADEGCVTVLYISTQKSNLSKIKNTLLKYYFDEGKNHTLEYYLSLKESEVICT